MREKSLARHWNSRKTITPGCTQCQPAQSRVSMGVKSTLRRLAWELLRRHRGRTEEGETRSRCATRYGDVELNGRLGTRLPTYHHQPRCEGSFVCSFSVVEAHTLVSETAKFCISEILVECLPKSNASSALVHSNSVLVDIR